MTILLLVVLVAGTEVNGSTRWIRIAGFTLQASEVAKVMMAIFTADYGNDGQKEVRSSASGLYRLVGVMIITVGLILLEPDLGATAVIVLMILGVFFPAGVPANSVYFLPDRNYSCLAAVLSLSLASVPYHLPILLTPWAPAISCLMR